MESQVKPQRIQLLIWMSVASTIVILFLAYFFYNTLSNNLLGNSRQFLGKQVEIASNEVQRGFNSFFEDLTYYSKSLESDIFADNEEVFNIDEARTRRLLNSYMSLIDTLFVQKGEVTKCYMIRDNNYFDKYELPFRKEFTDLSRYVAIASHSEDFSVTAAINVKDFFKEYASNHYLGEGGYKVYLQNENFHFISPDGEKKTGILFSKNTQENIIDEYRGGLRGIYEGNIIEFSDDTEHVKSIIAQYPFNLYPLKSDYAFIFAKDKGVIVSKIYSTYLMLFAGLFVLLMFIIYVMVKHFKGINSKNEQLQKKSDEINKLFQQQTMLLQETNGFVYYINANGEVSNVSENLSDVLGYTSEEFIRSNRSYILKEDLVNLQNKAWEAVQKKSDYLTFEFRILKKDGNMIHTKSFERLFYDEKGDFSGSVGICTDINEKYLAEQELIKSENRLRSVLNSLPDIIFIYNNNGVFLDYYVQSEELLLIPPKESIGKHIREVIPALEGEKIVAAFERALKTGRTQTEEMSLDIRGAKKVFEVRFFKLDDERMISMGREVTQQRIWEKGLKEAKEMAEEANRAKSEFLASMSHEIRTPMNGLLGMISLLESTPLNDEQKEFLNVIKDSGESLLAIIKDILDYSKIEEGKLELNLVQFNLKQELFKVTNIFSGLLAAKKLKLELDIANDLPEWIVLDKEKLSQIIFNIVGNAIKFTPKGGKVKVKVYGETIFDRNCMIYFSVVDTGIGIPKDKIERLIHPFTQAETGHFEEKSGSGLGLAIANKLIELMGGSLEIKSEEGKGAEFSFAVFGRVPDRIEGKAYMDQNEWDMEKSFSRISDEYPLSILLVEDNDINLKFMKLLMKQLGYNVDTAVNGLEAIKAVKDKKYDLIFMDYLMPLMGGLEAVSSIRSLENGQQVKIIGLSANVFKEDIEKALMSGMDDYMTKPIKIKEVVQKIKDSFGVST